MEEAACYWAHNIRSQCELWVDESSLPRVTSKAKGHWKVLNFPFFSVIICYHDQMSSGHRWSQWKGNGNKKCSDFCASLCQIESVTGLKVTLVKWLLLMICIVTIPKNQLKGVSLQYVLLDFWKTENLLTNDETSKKKKKNTHSGLVRLILWLSSNSHKATHYV